MKLTGCCYGRGRPARRGVVSTFAVAMVAATVGLVATQATAMTVAEVGDAGHVPGTAQAVAGGTTQITGQGSGLDATTTDIDVYAFDWGGGSLTIRTFGSTFDTMLFLFDSTGLGITANDDDITFGGDVLLSSRLTATLSPGTYLIGIADCCRTATSTSGIDGRIWMPFSGVGQVSPDGPGAAGTLNGWLDSVTLMTPTAGTSAYQIDFSAATVPEPGTCVLLGLGLAGMSMRRRSRGAL
jgi:hypothetical protein